MGLSDDQLVEQLKTTGDKLCFVPIFERYEKRIQDRCRAVLRSRAAAEDLAQDTFATALARIGQFQGGNFYGWLCTIARNLCLNHLARSRITVETQLCEEQVSVPDHENDFAWLEQLKNVLNHLSAPQRICMKLFYLDGYRVAEVAHITGFTEKEVKSHLQNGRRRFRILWKKEGGGR